MPKQPSVAALPIRTPDWLAPMAGTSGQALLAGYYGRRNAGDDAFLAVSAWAAKKYLRCRELFATASLLPNTYGMHVQMAHYRRDWPLVSRLNPMRELETASRAFSIIFGGGSNFHTAGKMQWFSKMLDRAGDGPHFATGVSIGPFQDRLAEVACKRLLRRLDFIGLRDAISLERVRDLAPRAEAELTFDIAPMLCEAVGERIPLTARSGLGIALCGFARMTDAQLEAQTRLLVALSFAIAAATQLGLVDSVVLLDLNGEPDLDASVHEHLMRHLVVQVPVHHVRYADDPVSTLKFIATLKGLIAMRLHAAVFGYCTDTPTAMLAYHEKCGEWAKMIRLDQSLVLDANDTGPNEMIQIVQSLLSGAAPRPQLPLEDALRQARRNWTWLASPAPSL